MMPLSVWLPGPMFLLGRGLCAWSNVPSAGGRSLCLIPCSFWGISVQKSLYSKGLCPGGLCPRRRFSVWRSLSGRPTGQRPPYGEEHPTGIFPCFRNDFNKMACPKNIFRKSKFGTLQIWQQKRLIYLYCDFLSCETEDRICSFYNRTFIFCGGKPVWYGLDYVAHTFVISLVILISNSHQQLFPVFVNW